MAGVPMRDTLDRYHARAIKSAILAENNNTFFRVDKGRLILKGDLTARQRELATNFRDELVAYLTTPPDQAGQCRNCKQPIEWVCNKYGDWVCSCYHRERLLNHQSLYTFGYLKGNTSRVLAELKRTSTPLVDVRYNPVSSHWEWNRSYLEQSGYLYYWVKELGNELYKTALTGNFKEPLIKLHNPDLGLKRLKEILERTRKAAIFCACTGKGCHRFEVAEQAAAVMLNVKIIHL